MSRQMWILRAMKLQVEVSPIDLLAEAHSVAERIEVSPLAEVTRC